MQLYGKEPPKWKRRVKPRQRSAWGYKTVIGIATAGILASGVYAVRESYDDVMDYVSELTKPQTQDTERKSNNSKILIQHGQERFLVAETRSGSGIFWPEIYDSTGRRNYDLERTVDYVSKEARQWVHYLYEDKPYEFQRKVLEFAGSEDVANLATYKTLVEHESEALERAAASMELAQFLQSPLQYGLVKFAQEFAKEWEKEKYKGITRMAGGYVIEGDKDVKIFPTPDEALKEKMRRKAQESAPTSYHPFEERKSYSGGESVRRGVEIGGPPKTPQQRETERRLERDPVYQTGKKIFEGRGSEAAQDVRRGAEQLIRTYREAAPQGAREAIRGVEERARQIFKPPERPAEGQRRERADDRSSERPKPPDPGKIIGDIFRRR